jgi:hypothetical protein
VIAGGEVGRGVAREQRERAWAGEVKACSAARAGKGFLKTHTPDSTQ